MSQLGNTYNTNKRNTIASAGENLSGNLQFYVMYTKFDIRATGDYSDDSHKLLQTIINLIHVRSQTVILGEAVAVTDLAAEGSPFTGAGYILKFTSEHDEVFAMHDKNTTEVTDPVYYLNNMFNDVKYDEDLTFKTMGTDINIAFKRFETI